MADLDVVIQNELLEVSFDAETQVVITGEETFDVLLEAGTEVSIDNDYIEVLTLAEGQPGPPGEPGTKVTVSVTPPANPRVGDIWFVKA